MIILSFELTMPNVGSWNGKWTGANKKYFVVRKLSNKAFAAKEYLKDLTPPHGYTSFYYNFGDGWGANVHVERVTSSEAAKRRKMSAGFCGYEWMIDSILMRGKITTN